MIYLGLDLGLCRDYSAIAVVERPERVLRFDVGKLANVWTPERDVLIVRHLERAKLDTPYWEVAQRVAEVLRHPKMAGRQRVAVDATGVGRPVVEMLGKARVGCTVSPVVMTSGYGEHSDGRMWYVPKMDLLAGLRSLLEREELQIARGMEEAPALVRELAAVEGKVGRSGRMRVGAEGAKKHDDLVVAVALACWAAEKGGGGEGKDRLWW